MTLDFTFGVCIGYTVVLPGAHGICDNQGQGWIGLHVAQFLSLFAAAFGFQAVYNLQGLQSLCYGFGLGAFFASTIVCCTILLDKQTKSKAATPNNSVVHYASGLNHSYVTIYPQCPTPPRPKRRNFYTP